MLFVVVLLVVAVAIAFSANQQGAPTRHVVVFFLLGVAGIIALGTGSVIWGFWGFVGEPAVTQSLPAFSTTRHVGFVAAADLLRIVRRCSLIEATRHGVRPPAMWLGLGGGT